MFRRKGKSKQRPAESIKSSPLLRIRSRENISPDSTVTPSTAALSTLTEITQVTSPLSTAEETGGIFYHRKSKGLFKFADSREFIETATGSATPHSRTRTRMDFLSMYFPATPRTRSGRGAEQTNSVGKHSEVSKLVSSNNSSETGFKTNRSLSPIENDHANSEHKGNYGNNNDNNNKTDANNSGCNENASQKTIIEDERRKNYCWEMSPLTQHYNFLRRTRRHHSEADMETWTAERDLSVHFLAPLADDSDSLQTIVLTPKIGCAISDEMNGVQTRHQSLDEIHYIQSATPGSSSALAHNKSLSGFKGHHSKSNTTSTHGVTAEIREKNGSREIRDEENEKGFNFFGIKFRR